MTKKNNMIKIGYYLQTKLPFVMLSSILLLILLRKKIKSLLTLIARPFLDYVLWNNASTSEMTENTFFMVFL